MNLPFEIGLYSNVKLTWPESGRHILGTFDETSIILYQAYNSKIAKYAVDHQTFLNCPEFSTTRMTWLKPNFLWMMYRSGWGTKDDNQRYILAITITRKGFEEILKNSESTTRSRVSITKSDSSTTPVIEEIHTDNDVRLQWDPDHDPKGDKEIRRAIQLGIKNKILNKFLNEWIIKIDDITQFVIEQWEFVKNDRLDLLQIPQEKVYILNDKSLMNQIQLDEY